MAVKIQCNCHYCSNKKWHDHHKPKKVGLLDSYYNWATNQDYIYNRLHIPERDFLILQSHGIKLRMCMNCYHVYVYVRKAKK